jgi:hypothetical protein
MPQAGGQASVNVNTNAGCVWAAASGASWITLTGAATGSGPGTVTFTVDQNRTGQARQGTLTVQGVTLTISQAAN